MNFDFTWQSVLVAVLTSAIGFVYFTYGKRQQQFKMMLCGMGLMTYTYFTPNLWWDFGVGVLLTALPFVWR